MICIFHILVLKFSIYKNALTNSSNCVLSWCFLCSMIFFSIKTVNNIVNGAIPKRFGLTFMNDTKAKVFLFLIARVVQCKGENGIWIYPLHSLVNGLVGLGLNIKVKNQTVAWKPHFMAFNIHWLYANQWVIKLISSNDKIKGTTSHPIYILNWITIFLKQQNMWLGSLKMITN